VATKPKKKKKSKKKDKEKAQEEEADANKVVAKIKPEYALDVEFD
jgi:hypothetical protein